MTWSKPAGRAALAAGLLGGTVVAGAWAEARAFTVRRVRVPVLPPGRRELRVLHISDIHLMARQARKREFVSRLAGLRPDLVINTGDNIAQAKALEPLLAALEELLVVPGGFVFGSNDLTEPRFRNPISYLFGNSRPPRVRPPEMPWQRLRDAFTAAGWVYLENRSARLQVAGLTIDLRGTGDAHHDLDDYARVAGPVASDADLTLGVTHAPYRRVLDAMVADGVQMIFAGHTHGGQICLPVNRAIIDNCDLPTEQASGLSTWSAAGQTAPLHVSAGIGTAPSVTLRLFCRPEATLLRMVPRG